MTSASSAVRGAPNSTTDAAEPRVREWQFLTGADFERMDRASTVVMVTVSPLEVHGPHLPVITDNLEAEAVSAKVIELLGERHPEIRFLRLPPVYVAADVLPHPGSVMFRSSTITRVVEDLGRSLARQGFRHIWVSSFHGGPRHFVPIEVACDRVNRRYGASMVSAFSLLVKRLTNGGSDLSKVLVEAVPGLTAEDLRGDMHAGAVETSLMLHLLGQHVSPGYRELPQVTPDHRLAEKGLPPLSQDSVVSLLRGLPHKLKYYERDTYSGKPAAASAEKGARILEVLSGHAADALSEVWTGKLSADQCHSPLWPFRWFFTSERLGWVLERALRYKNRVF